jgi:RNA ligase (TIGR02306 family)
MAEKKSNHQVKVVRIGEPRVHTNADTLELVDIPDTDYQVVVKKGEFKAGDFAVYIQPDSVVPQTEPFRFIWEGHIGVDGTVPEKRRRITVRKFRKEWSEGLLLIDHAFPELEGKLLWEGTDVSDILNITHYVPPEPIENFSGQRPKPYRWMPKSIRGWFFYILRLIGIDPDKAVGGRPAPGPDNSPAGV